MSFIPYLFKKDIDRLKLIFAAWVLLIIIQSALTVGGAKLATQHFAFNILMPQVTMLIRFLQGLMTIVIVPMVVHGDSLVGTTAFWFTRPISRKSLLIAKASLILFALIIFPMLAELFVLGIHGVTTRHIFLAVPEILLEKTAFVLPFLILASLTPKFSRYALVGAILFAGIVLISIIASFADILFDVSFRNSELYGNASLEASSKVVRQITIILFGSCLVFYQFLTRRTARTIGLLVAFFIFLWSPTRMWEWDFLKYVPSGSQLSLPEDSVSVDFDFNHAIVAEEFRFRKAAIRSMSISLKQTVSGLPPEQFALLENLREPKIRYPDGKVVESGYVSNRMPMRSGALEDRFMMPIQAVLKDMKLVNPVMGNFSHTEVFSVDMPDFKIYKNKAGTYSAIAEFEIYEYKVSSSVPLKEGASSSFGSEQILIDDILEDSNRISVVIVEKKVNLLFDRTVEKVSKYDFFGNLFFSNFKRVYLIANKKRNEALLAEAGRYMGDPTMGLFGSLRLKTNPNRFEFILINDQGTILTEIDKGWLAEAELMRLDAKKIGKIETDVLVENFYIPSESTEKNQKIDEFDQRLRMQLKEMEEQTSEMQKK